jgi:hypothetical protein
VVEQRWEVADTEEVIGEDMAVGLAAEEAVDPRVDLAGLAVEVSEVAVPVEVGNNKKRSATPTFSLSYMIRLHILDNHGGSSPSSITNACTSNLTVILL